jgi:hypothetical protein
MLIKLVEVRFSKIPDISSNLLVMNCTKKTTSDLVILASHQTYCAHLRIGVCMAALHATQPFSFACVTSGLARIIPLRDGQTAHCCDQLKISTPFPSQSWSHFEFRNTSSTSRQRLLFILRQHAVRSENVHLRSIQNPHHLQSLSGREQDFNRQRKQTPRFGITFRECHSALPR